jgi:N-carbamoyl-L-amino-acid hydrolase
MSAEDLLPRSQRASEAFLVDFAEMSEFGATPAGGVDREAATAADAECRRWFARWLRDREFRVVRDRIGNLFGFLELNPGAPYILCGSHLDSQPRGGKYDGAYGVLAAAHAADRVRRYFDAKGQVPRYNLAVVDWFNEEGSRFKPSMMGSAVFVGKLGLETALKTTDPTGSTVREALTIINERGDTDVFGDAHGPVAYAEIHIEQGKELEKSGIDIGVVPSTWAANKYEISVHGAQAHTGAAEMADRQDALYGAALAVVAVRELANDYDLRLHTSCGQLNVYPDSPVVVAREVRMHLDLRSPDDAILAEADLRLQQQFAEIEVKANVKIEKRAAHTWPAHAYQPAGIALAETIAADLGLTTLQVRTRAGHDSTNMKDVVPTVMLFIPSVDGVSHSELEYTADHDMTNGVDLISELVLRMSMGTLNDAVAP